MACKIAINSPLRNLMGFLGVSSHHCHSLRETCIHHLEQIGNDEMFYGSLGAIVGYCQALFNKLPESAAAENTRKVTTLLEEAGMPFPKSHELFFGHKNPKETVQEFLDESTRPLRGIGRVPILITGLQTSQNGDMEIIKSITETGINIIPDETALIRILIDDTDMSLNKTADLIFDLIKKAEAEKKMPQWWPLLQGDISPATWKKLKEKLGEYWKFTNVAINPFCSVPDFVMDQVTVGQLVVGAAEGVSEETIRLAPGMKILGARDEEAYEVEKYFSQLGFLAHVPTIIVLGPSLPQWSDDDNKARLSALLPLLRGHCEKLWKIGERFGEVWQLAA